MSTAPNLVLAMDIGATSIKMADVSSDGVIVSAIRRRPTPYPCTPTRLVDWLAERIAKRGIDRVGVGFPGDFRDGVVHAPGNLARPQGRASAVDPVLDSQWRGFAFQDALRERSGVDIRVVNDASMAAYGCLTGVGRELVLALGTGFGVALAEDGKLLTIPDYGQRLFDDRHTYDEVAGERARGSDEISWHANVITVVHALAAEWGVQSVHLAGGNSQRLRSSEVATPAFTVTIHGNRAPLLGAVKLFVPVG